MACKNKFIYWDNTFLIRQEIVEKAAFKIIKEEVTNKLELYSNAAVVNAFGVRAYIPVKRAFNDLDISFPTDFSFDNILRITEKYSNFVGLSFTKPEYSSIRVKYNIRGMPNLAHEFSIHLHLSGVWYNKKLFFLDKAFFQSVKILEVPSVNNCSVLLPIPSLEELFILKLIKFVGSDILDVLSILTHSKIDNKYIEIRLRSLQKHTSTLNNLCYILDNFDIILNNWSSEHLCDMQSRTIKSVKRNLQKFIKKLK